MGGEYDALTELNVQNEMAPVHEEVCVLSAHVGAGACEHVSFSCIKNKLCIHVCVKRFEYKTQAAFSFTLRRGSEL